MVVRRRVIYLDGSPTELTDTYYPWTSRTGRALPHTQDPWRRGDPARDDGLLAHRVHEEVYARMPNAAERDELALAEGEPVLCMTRVTENGDGRPFRADVSVFPAAGQRLRYEPRIG